MTLPQKDDQVKFTYDMINHDTTANSFKDKTVTVLKVSLKKIISSTENYYDIFFSADGKMGKIEDVHSNGSKLVLGSWLKVFEYCDQDAEDTDVSMKASEDDRCKKCGTMGNVKSTSCVCPNCGNVVWGF